jgi:hypothetical protein
MDMDLSSPLRSSSPTSDRRSKRPRGRLVDRDGGFAQSLGNFSIQRLVNAHMRWMYAGDWFHTLVNTRFHRIAFAVIFVYVAIWLTFAIVYMLAASHDRCFPEIYGRRNGKNGTEAVGHWTHFLRATFFSIETMMTIGYGVEQWHTLSDCPQLLVVIALQSLIGVFTSSILFGIVLTRVSRSDKRARTVIFSGKAIVRIAPHPISSHPLSHLIFTTPHLAGARGLR